MNDLEQNIFIAMLAFLGLFTLLLFFGIWP